MKPITINTHIDCSNNSKCSVRDILLAINQGAFLCIFCYHEYIATYVDDLCITAQDPGKIIQILKEDYKLKVKRNEPLSHPLGADNTRDKTNTLVCQQKSILMSYLSPTSLCSSKIHPKNENTPGQE